MGCSSSSAGSDPGSADGYNERGRWNDDKEFTGETNYARKRLDKKTGKAGGAEKEKPESDFFEPLEAGQGEQFMAVRPYEGAIMEPANHPPPNPSAPSVNFELEYVYGYRCADSRQNCFFNGNNQAVYMTAALGIILDPASNTQKFFGGGQVENTSKMTANDTNGHTNDITALAISDCRSKVATGQVGSSPAAFVWDSSEGGKQARYKLPKGARGVNGIGISQDGSMVACVDLHNDHNVHVFDASSGSGLWTDKGDTNKVMDVAWSSEPGSKRFATAGSKHIKFWDVSTKVCKKGIFGGKGEQTSFACVTWDNKGNCFTGGCNSQIYHWVDRNCQGTVKAHKSGFICSIRWMNDTLYSGGKDGQVVITDPSSMTVKSAIDFGCLIRAIDVKDNNLLVGLRDGTIYQSDLSGGNKKILMESHSEGELWGLASVDDNRIVTSGDDNKVKVWNINDRKCVSTGKVSTTNNKSKRGGASTLSDFPAS